MERECEFCGQTTDESGVCELQDVHEQTQREMARENRRYDALYRNARRVYDTDRD